MRDQRDLMIEKQAELISKLSAEAQKVPNLQAALYRKSKAENFYLDLMKQIEESPILQSEWQRFCSFLKMAADEEYMNKNGA